MHISTRPTYDYVYDRSLNLVANRAITLLATHMYNKYWSGGLT